MLIKLASGEFIDPSQITYIGYPQRRMTNCGDYYQTLHLIVNGKDLVLTASNVWGSYNQITKAVEEHKPNNFEITDEISGFRIQGVIHEDSEVSHRCEVWVYDEKERIARVRMVGSSMLHVMNAAITEAHARLAKITE